MNQSLKATFDLLASTPNEAAVAVLVAALELADGDVRAGAIRALIDRRSPVGHAHVLALANRLDDSMRSALVGGIAPMRETLAEALLGDHRGRCFGARQLVVWARAYDLLPEIVSLAEDVGRPNADLGRSAVLELAGTLGEELAGPREFHRRRDPQMARRQAIACLEKSLHQFDRHHCREIAEAYLSVARRDDAGLRTMLAESREVGRQAVLDAFRYSDRSPVLRLLASFLDASHPPLCVMRVLAERSDVAFVRTLLRHVGDAPLGHTADNVQRIQSLGWLGKAADILPDLDETEQRQAVHFVMASGISDDARFLFLGEVLDRGGSHGRQAAMRAMADIHTPEADAIVVAAAADPDPGVQAAALLQLRDRGISGSMNLLIERVGSPDEAVRDAVRNALGEFRIGRFLTTFETLSEDVQITTGQLVRQIDPETVPTLRSELASASRARRLKAIHIVAAMALERDLADEIATLGDDSDALIRREASRLISRSTHATHRPASSHNGTTP